MCELCYIIPDKDKRGRIMVKKCFVLHEEVIENFHKKSYIPTIENFNLILFMSGCLVQQNMVRLEIFFHDNALKNLKLKKDYSEKFSKATSIEIQSQHWGGNRQLSMEGIAVEYFPTSVDNGNNEEKY